MKIIKNIIIISILLIIVFSIPITCQASDVIDELGDLDQYGKVQGSYDVFRNKVGVFLGFFQMLGSIVSVICLIVMGVKYMMGSVEEKAEYKKTLFPYILGAFMVFATVNLLQVVYEVVINAF
jgi:type IV secretory pathway VirB2 component (pilin)